MEKTPNRLIHSQSPYLLQHAYNPVDWHEWHDDSLKKATNDQKLIIVSIGYSACHWCHVMEHESFENHEVAEIMNQHFINIKVDREERPDIDQIYMYAVQLMRGTGGWPLNCICLPDGRPIYGGTYFKKEEWINLLSQLAKLWKENPQEAINYAQKLSEGIQQIESIIPNPEAKNEFDIEQIEEILISWKRNFDMTYGGYTRAPKFPIPNNWLFLLQYAALYEDITVHHATLFCLQKMALGGIYDPISGGFARYSVDERWHIPHFEKMLYDNAQLISLYSHAYSYANMPLFKHVAQQSIEWINEELRSTEGLFYAALDADSEGVEGKYYVWQKHELLQHLPKEDVEIFCEYYGISEEGNWHEEKTNVLMAVDDIDSFAEMHHIENKNLQKRLNNCLSILKKVRKQRIAPGLDHKIITSWNGLMIKALCDSYKAFGCIEYLDNARNAARLIIADSQNNGLNRIYKKTDIKAFLDDYAAMIDALIALYECTFDEKWLYQALKWTEYVIDNYSHPDNSLFYYTHQNSEVLIARKCEITDNVIPSSNSMMAHNLQKLGLFFERQDFQDRYKEMLRNTSHLYKSYGSAYSNWVSLALQEISGSYEIAVSGHITPLLKQELFAYYIPFKIYMGNTPSTLPLLKEKDSIETKIYICKNKVCSLPFDELKSAFQFINTGN